MREGKKCMNRVSLRRSITKGKVSSALNLKEGGPLFLLAHGALSESVCLF